MLAEADDALAHMHKYFVYSVSWDRLKVEGSSLARKLLSAGESASSATGGEARGPPVAVEAASLLGLTEHALAAATDLGTTPNHDKAALKHALPMAKFNARSIYNLCPAVAVLLQCSYSTRRPFLQICRQCFI